MTGTRFQMIYIENDSLNPYFNLALEEYLLTRGSGPVASGDVLLLWRNDKTVVVGRYQNTEQEINEQFCRANEISIVRRNTGGGAVYHDLGNLNFSMIAGYKQGDDVSLGRFLKVVRETLGKLGVGTQLQGRNDLAVDGLKISGSAQAIVGGRILHHGTLLCSTDLGMLSGALRNQKGLGEDAGQSGAGQDGGAGSCGSVYRSKAVASVRSRVANISDFNNAVTVSVLKDCLLAEFGGPAPLERRELTAADLAEIRLLQKSKYETWQWNYGESPEISRKE